MAQFRLVEYIDTPVHRFYLQTRPNASVDWTTVETVPFTSLPPSEQEEIKPKILVRY